MHAVALPALDGRHQLAFLAAVGATRLLAEHGARLAWKADNATAVIHSTLPDLDAVVIRLQQIAAAIAPDVAAPGIPAGFPPKPRGKGGDPMLKHRHEFRDFTATMDPRCLDWTACMVTDLALDEQDRTRRTLWMAPSGKQSIHSFLDKNREWVTRDPQHIRDALAGWRRIPGCTGEYFDHGVLRNAAADPLGDSADHGVPGATWLATMALPLTRVTATETGTIQATAWHRIDSRTPPIIVWPLWQPPLSPQAIRVLLEHPALRPTSDDITGTPTVHMRRLKPLGVHTVYAAERWKPNDGRKFAGALAPTQLNTT